MNIFDHIKDRSLAHIIRYNSSPQHFHESVAEHSFFVAYITSLLCRLLKKHGETIDHEKAVTMALVHDMEEKYSGDILSPFKHHSEEVTEAIRKVNKAGVREIFQNLPPELGEHYITLWNEENAQESKEAQVVKVADRLSLLAKCKEEMAAGNNYFEHIYNREYPKLADDTRPWWQKIKDEVLEQDTL